MLPNVELFEHYFYSEMIKAKEIRTACKTVPSMIHSDPKTILVLFITFKTNINFKRFNKLINRCIFSKNKISKYDLYFPVDI